MAYISIDLSEFEDCEVVEDVCYRIANKLDDDEIAEIQSAIIAKTKTSPPSTNQDFNIVTTNDKFKLELMIKRFDDFTLEELEKRLTP